ncbi:hypothetical protein KZO83_09335 [Chromohalobacter sp. TMW 2.2308]|uniref:hypothetical protein n=1 Tax=Chromohalobacter TaxID=42054 RepID=UPI001FFD65B7|nr:MULTISPECIES: hypothetical protein [Chromohalobacter]MCK2042896.1 hypothetical protein [Chromohalobacter moromii]MCT8514584.1 hypothetical protein [Chromohalobacter sp. TMW 2.2271]
MIRMIAAVVLTVCSASSFAEDEFALVDSVRVDSQGIITSLSIQSRELPEEQNQYKFDGTIWSNEFGGPRPVVISIDDGLVDEVKVDTTGGVAEIPAVDQLFTYGEHTYAAGEQTFVRSQYYSQGSNAFIFVSDDPGPFAIAAFLAGSVVAICATDRIVNYFQCDGNSGGEISLKSGFTCTTECN